MAKIGWKKRLSVYMRDRFICRYCGKRLHLQDVTLDHILPRSKGGSHSESNLATACSDCNLGKSSDILFPVDMVFAKSRFQGWFIHKHFGIFSVEFSEYELCLCRGSEHLVTNNSCYDDEFIEEIRSIFRFSGKRSVKTVLDFDRALACIRGFVVDSRNMDGQN